MLSIVAILAVTAAIIWIEVPVLLKKGQKKELWVFSILLFVGMTLSLAQGLNIKIPNPMNGVIIVLKPVSDAVLAWLM